MQAVLLAAGAGERCGPLTETKPKSLLRVANKPIIEYNLKALSGLVEGAIIVVGYLKDKLEMHLGNYYGADYYSSIKIKYVTQKEQLGTWDALIQAKPFIRSDRVIVMTTDDFYSKSDIEKLLKYRNAVLGKKGIGKKGVIVIENGLVKGIDEMAISKEGDLVNAGGYIFTRGAFDTPLFKPENQKEYYLTDLVEIVARGGDFHYEVVEDLYLSISYPWDLLKMNEKILKGMEKDFNFMGAPFRNNRPLAHSVRYDERDLGNRLTGLVIIEDDCEITNSTIEGPVIIGKNCRIGPYVHIRPYSAIGDGCHIGDFVIIKNSIIGCKTNVPHLNYVGDSVIGENCNIGAGTVIGNQRLDESEIGVYENSWLINDELWQLGKKIGTGLDKLGALVGDNVRLATNLKIQPGTRIPSNLMVYDSVLRLHNGKRKGVLIAKKLD